MNCNRIFFSSIGKFKNLLRYILKNLYISTETNIGECSSMCSHRYVLFAKQMRLLSPEVLWSPLHQTQTNKSRFLPRDRVEKGITLFWETLLF